MKSLHKCSPFHALFLVLLFNVISGGAAVAQSGAGLSMPDWMSVDNDQKKVVLDVVAGKTDVNNRWNFNGLAKGEASIVVPEGYTVVINFKNDDPNMMHSLGLVARADAFPPVFDKPTPVFAGAMSANATDMATATQSGKSEVLTFKADKAGKYAMACLIPAHALTGMWIGFDVSADGKAGLMSKGG